MGYRGVDKNITERKSAEEVIRQSEARLSYSQEVARMGSWVLDIRTNRYTWSKNMYIILGYQPFEKELTFNDFFNLVHPEDKTIIDYYNREIFRTLAGVSFDFRFLLPGDNLIWIQSNIEPVFRNDELVELHGVNIDITDKKGAEQELKSAKERAEASDKLKTAFLNNISHEIRTPLNGILGFGQILIDENLTQEEKDEYLNILNKSGERLINTVTNYVDISMISSGNQKVNKRNVYLVSILNSVIRAYNDTCKSKKIDLLLDLTDPDANTLLFTDDELLSKILCHLVDNAVKFTSEGSVIVGCQILEKEFLFSVKDTGIGITGENQQKVFKNFVQEEISNTRGYEGSGLGLSIATGLIELLGGRIWMESEKGTGSTFYFTIPV
jgi:PAS domain S-box-containing protein